MSKPVQPVPFELQKHAAEAIVENIYAHTVGLAGYPPVFLGSAVAIRWKGRALVVTADHVIKGVDDSQLLFAPRPPVPLKLNDGPQDAMRGRVHRLEKLPVIRRYRQEAKDVAALEVPLELEEQRPLLRFYDLSESLKLPRPMPESVTMIGFPGDALEQPSPGVWTFSGHLLTAQPQRYTGQTLKDFLPRSNFPLTFPPATDGRKPQGFSGTGIWYQSNMPKTELWVPKLILLGICTSYYDRSQLLCALRIERILTFLREFVG
ncbi:MAG: hypothetical protein WCE53_14675 [Candidatus Acidiferrum sp.]